MPVIFLDLTAQEFYINLNGVKTAVPLLIGDTKVVSGDYTFILTDSIILADAIGGDMEVTLPSPTLNRAATVKKIDNTGNKVDILTPGGATIDGAASIELSSVFESRTMISDGTDWFLLSTVP